LIITGSATTSIMMPTKAKGQRYPQEEAMIPPKKGPAAIPRLVMEEVRPYAFP